MIVYTSDLASTRMPQPAFVELVVSDVPADAHRIGALRSALQAWLDDRTVFTRSRIAEIVLAVYEAMANAVEHAYHHTASTGTIGFRAAYSSADRVLQIAVTDHGHWREPRHEPLRGNGLPLMNALSTTASVDHTDEGTSVLLQWER